MYPPVGWQNLSATKHKTRDREAILPAVRLVHPDAYESQLAEGLYAYWLPQRERNRSRLIAIAWGDQNPWWSYAIMSKMAFDIGVQCSLFPVTANRYRILPHAGEGTPTIHRQIKSAKARLKRLGLAPPETFFHVDPQGGWHITFEIPRGDQTFGPYGSFDDASRAVPSLMRQVQESISQSG